MGRSLDGVTIFDLIRVIWPVSEMSMRRSLLCAYRNGLGRSPGVSVVGRANGARVGALS
jgi:hypothetical protein